MKKKTIVGLVAATALSVAMNTKSEISLRVAQNSKETPDDVTKETTSDTLSLDTLTLNKRIPQKVYCRFEEIPEISDMETMLYNKNEYTYIADLDLYQQTGKLKLKRVLKDEVTQVNLISTIYRSECGDHILKENEDPLLTYEKNPWNLSKSRIYIGSTQMDDVCILNLVKYLVATPKNRKYILPLLKCSSGSVESAAQELQQRFFDEKGQNLPLEQRTAALSCKAYTSLDIKENAWATVCSPEFKQKLQKNFTAKGISISDKKKTYLYIAETIPDFDKELENFQLGFYPLGRICKPNQIIETLAENLNLRDNQNQIDATRVPVYAVSASISHLNWKGNGIAARNSAKQHFSKNWKNEILQTVKLWVTGKARKFGIDEMAKLNILTPQIIKQYKLMELSGASRLLKEYLKQVNLAEKRAHISAKKRGYRSAHLFSKTKILMAKDFSYQKE